MLHVFSCERHSKAEVLFPPIVNLTSSIVQDILQWGWKLEGSRVQPIVIDIEPVPGNLFKFVPCKCKLSMKNPCGNNISSSRKHKLKSVVEHVAIGRERIAIMLRKLFTVSDLDNDSS